MKPWWLMGSKQGIPENTRPRIVVVESGAGYPCEIRIYHGEPCEGNGVALRPNHHDLRNAFLAIARELEKEWAG